MNTNVILLNFFLGCAIVPSSWGIYGGTPAAAGQFPYIVSINNPFQGEICDGVIINENWVLTSGVCADVVDDTAYMFGGTVNKNEGGITFNISKVIFHDDFVQNEIKNDIALLQVDGSFQFDDNLQPIEIGVPEVNATCQAAGWGGTEYTDKPDELYYVNVRVIAMEECEEALAGKNQYYMGPEQICAGGVKSEGICIGDFGGPLVCGNKLVGIVSYLVVFCGRGNPDVYTMPSAYEDWINEHIK